MNEKEKELKDVNKLLRRRLEWYRVTGITYDPSDDQCSIYPRALSDNCGKPHTGNKSVWTERLSNRYDSSMVVSTMFPDAWVPELVLINGMFMLNTKPLCNSKTITK